MEENKLDLEAKILLGALVVLVIVCISSVSYTVLGRDSDKPVTGQVDFFDPITLRTVEPVAENISEMSMITLPPIRIPVRPVMRSPFRPSWASSRQIGNGEQ